MTKFVECGYCEETVFLSATVKCEGCNQQICEIEVEAYKEGFFCFICNDNLTESEKDKLHPLHW